MISFVLRTNKQTTVVNSILQTRRSRGGGGVGGRQVRYVSACLPKNKCSVALTLTLYPFLTHSLYLSPLTLSIPLSLSALLHHKHICQRDRAPPVADRAPLYPFAHCSQRPRSCWITAERQKLQISRRFHVLPPGRSSRLSFTLNRHQSGDRRLTSGKGGAQLCSFRSASVVAFYPHLLKYPISSSD